MHPCRMEQIDSVKINHSLVMMRELLMQLLADGTVKCWRQEGLGIQCCLAEGGLLFGGDGIFNELTR